MHSSTRTMSFLNLFSSTHRRPTRVSTPHYFFKPSANPANRPNSVSNVGFSLESYVAQKADSVNKALEAAISLHHLEEIIIPDAMRYSLFPGGKRIHPLLCIAACELVGGSESTAMPTACALEMIHTSSLVHDDMPCMDNGELRRRKPPCHKRFGEDVALLIGNALLVYSLEHVTCATIAPASQVVQVIRELSNAAGIGGLVTGQIADMRSQGVEDDLRMERLEYIHFHKAARLVEAAVVSGVILGGGNVAEIEKLRKYAKCIGLLHQLVDDVLDVTKSPEELGKTTGKDALDGKVTYPRVVGMDRAREIAHELNQQGNRYLAGFRMEKAAPLIALANYIASRQR